MKKYLALTCNTLFWCLLALSLVACDKVVDTQAIGQPVWETRTAAGNKPGFCYSCGMDFHGKYQCGFKMSAICPCSYKADELIQRVEFTYESGKKIQSEKVLGEKNAETCM